MSSLCSNATSNVLRRSRATAPSHQSHPSSRRGHPIAMTAKFSTSLSSTSVPTLGAVSSFQPMSSPSGSSLSGSLSKVRCSRSYSSAMTGLMDGSSPVSVGSTVNDTRNWETLYATCAAVAATVALVTAFPGGARKSLFLPPGGGGGGGGPELHQSLMYAGAALREKTPNEGKAQITEDRAVSLKASKQTPRFYEVSQCQMDLLARSRARPLFYISHHVTSLFV
jgi:hypothetical protein